MPSLVSVSLDLIFFACQNGGTLSNSDGQTVPSDGSTLTFNSYEQIDQFDLATLKKSGSRESEGGDCTSRVTTYEGKGLKIVIDSSDCGDNGKYFTYYLLDDKEGIRMVQVKNIEPVYDEDDGQHQLFYSLSEMIIDFRGADPAVKMRADKVPLQTAESTVTLDENYNSPTWVILNEKGDHFVLDKKVDFKGDWYELSKKAIKDRLSEMTILPKQIPIQINGQLGMGIRGEFRSMCEEAINEVVSLKEYEMRQQIDQFKRMTKPFVVVPSPGDEGTLDFWNKRYDSL